MARLEQLTALRSNRGLLILALLSGLAAAILVFVALAQSDDGGGSTAPAATTSKVVVALRDIAAGTEIQADMLKVQDVPTNLLVKGAFSDTGLVVGETTRYPVVAGEQLSRLKVGPQVEDNNGLSFVVPKGLRAVSVRIDETSGVGGLLLPGDRVDVIAVIPEEDQTDVDKAVTVLQNIEVLAVAQVAQEPLPPAGDRTGTDPQADAAATSGQRPEDAKPQPDAHTATLAVTPQQALLLALAQEKGKVWLSLRSFGEDGITDLPVTTLDSLLGR